MPTLPNLDLSGLARELNALRDELRKQSGPEDLTHLKKMIRWGRTCTALGYATAWIAPNPLSAMLIGQGNFNRWAMIAHHVLHRGYDKIPDAPAHLTSKGFAQGKRRLVDWLDWMYPEAWVQEHNFLHHYKLGEEHDPDQPELNLEFLRESNLPMPLRYALVGFFAVTWKFFYYAPNTMKELHHAHQRRDKVEGAERLDLFDWRVWNPLKEPGRQVWTQCWLPYIGVNFIAIPAAFLLAGSLINPLLGLWMGSSVLINRVLAEVVANIYSFIIIVPNHAGDDIYRFEEPIDSRDEFYLRQIIGSVNYATGGDLTDFLHGWLNYQIEHHLWPDMTMLQYQKAQPRVKALCEQYGVPYVQESVFKRVKKLVDVMVGKTTMPVWEGPAKADAQAGEAKVAAPSAVTVAA